MAPSISWTGRAVPTSAGRWTPLRSSRRRRVSARSWTGRWAVRSRTASPTPSLFRTGSRWTAVFYEGTLPEDAARALAPLQDWFGEAVEQASRPTPTPGAYPGAVMAAVRALSEQLDVPPEEITVAAWEPVDWPDTSIGCPQPGMVYAQVIVPGYVVFLETRGETFRVHTDRAGQRVCIP